MEYKELIDAFAAKYGMGEPPGDEGSVEIDIDVLKALSSNKTAQLFSLVNDIRRYGIMELPASNEVIQEEIMGDANMEIPIKLRTEINRKADELINQLMPTTCGIIDEILGTETNTPPSTETIPENTLTILRRVKKFAVENQPID